MKKSVFENPLTPTIQTKAFVSHDDSNTHISNYFLRREATLTAHL